MVGVSRLPGISGVEMTVEFLKTSSANDLPGASLLVYFREFEHFPFI